MAAAAAAAGLGGMDRFYPSLAAQLGFWLLTSAAYFGRGLANLPTVLPVNSCYTKSPSLQLKQIQSQNVNSTRKKRFSLVRTHSDLHQSISL